MWRVLLLASLFALLGLGTAAYAECTSCLTSVFAERTPSNNIQLTFTATATNGAILPDHATAVVMQVDGNRTKCLNLALNKSTQVDGVAVYKGSFGAYGTYSHSGRVELGGQIYEFTVPLNGTGGNVALSADQTPLSRGGLGVVVTAAPVPVSPNLAVAPTRPGLELPKIDPAFLIGAGVIFVTIVGAFIDRRRALARSLAA
jgi:hypothetical protein